MSWYWKYQDILRIQKEGVAMGAPTSSIFSEIYLTYLGNTKLLDILLDHHTFEYFRYIDDIRIVYKNEVTNVYDVLTLFNNITLTLKFTMEEGNDNKINFLDITISKTVNDMSFNIYRKPTTTDTIIRIDSCHPPEHNFVAVRYLTDRLKTYTLNDTDKKRQKKQ
jgi:Reverse transcriptase (RNA-dependent DNA polymerase).